MTELEDSIHYALRECKERIEDGEDEVGCGMKEVEEGLDDSRHDLRRSLVVGGGGT